MKRIVKDIVLAPGGLPLRASVKRASIKLWSGPAYADSGQREVLGTTYADIDRATGYWEQSLDVNADLVPAGGYYTVRIGDVTRTFVVGAGSGPVWLSTCLIDPPTVDPPAVPAVLTVTGTGVDNTDPRNPVITGSGGGGGSVSVVDNGDGTFTITFGSSPTPSPNLIYGSGVYGSGVYSPAA